MLWRHDCVILVILGDDDDMSQWTHTGLKQVQSLWSLAILVYGY